MADRLRASLCSVAVAKDLLRPPLTSTLPAGCSIKRFVAALQNVHSITKDTSLGTPECEGKPCVQGTFEKVGVLAEPAGTLFADYSVGARSFLPDWVPSQEKVGKRRFSSSGVVTLSVTDRLPGIRTAK